MHPSTKLYLKFVELVNDCCVHVGSSECYLTDSDWEALECKLTSRNIYELAQDAVAKAVSNQAYGIQDCYY